MRVNVNKSGSEHHAFGVDRFNGIISHRSDRHNATISNTNVTAIGRCTSAINNDGVENSQIQHGSMLDLEPLPPSE